MLSKKKKKEIIESLGGVFEKNDTIFLVDFSGLSTLEINDLKDDIRKHGAKLQVVKKSLLPLVWRKSKIDISLEEHKGSLAFIYGEPESIETARSVTKFSKAHEKIVLLGGIFHKEFSGPEKIKALASLPSKEELVGKLLYLMNPAGSLVRVVSAPVSGLVNVINNIKDKK